MRLFGEPGHSTFHVRFFARGDLDPMFVGMMPAHWLEVPIGKSYARHLRDLREVQRMSARKRSRR